MNGSILFLASTVMATMAWSIPFYPVARAPLRVTRYAPPYPPQYRIPVRQIHVEEQSEKQHWERPKRQRDDYHHDDDHKETSGITGPVHTFVKTDKNANYKWGVRHHVGNKFAS